MHVYCFHDQVLTEAGEGDEKDSIGVNGAMEYLGALNVDLESAAFLIPMEIMQVPSMGLITKDGFVNGWRAVG